MVSRNGFQGKEWSTCIGRITLHIPCQRLQKLHVISFGDCCIGKWLFEIRRMKLKIYRRGRLSRLLWKAEQCRTGDGPVSFTANRELFLSLDWNYICDYREIRGIASTRCKIPGLGRPKRAYSYPRIQYAMKSGECQWVCF